MPKKKGNLLGAWAFLIGVILAVLFGLFEPFAWLGLTLVVIGLIIGLLNITDAEIQPFLIAGMILVLVSHFGGYVFGADVLGFAFLANILKNMLLLFVPATIIVALKSVFSISKK